MPTKTIKTGLKSASAAVALSLSSAPLLALEKTEARNTNLDVLLASFVEDDGAADHMVYAAKLRALSPRISAAACYEHFGIEKEASAEVLLQSMELFDIILKGLEHGDPALGLMKPETDRKILADIAEVHKIWDPLHGLIRKVAAGDSTDNDVILLVKKGKVLVDLTGHLSSLIMAEYSDPTVLLQKDAVTLEIAGRLPMMAQRMSKDLCLVTGGLEVEASTQEFLQTRGLFEKTLVALRDGMPALGLKPTTDPKILAQLETASSKWAELRPIFDKLEQGDVATKEQEAQVFYGIDELTKVLDDIEQSYSEASKMGL